MQACAATAMAPWRHRMGGREPRLTNLRRSQAHRVSPGKRFVLPSQAAEASACVSTPAWISIQAST